MDDYGRFVLTDPVAFDYLAGDGSTTVVERSAELRGYECYIVEQWATSRTHPTCVITTFTGDPARSVVAHVLSIPKDECLWSPRLRVYFKALNQFHTSRRETSLGLLLVANLSSFPSSLTVIPVPDGDFGKHCLDFTVNEDLKRLGCSGRSSLTLTAPSGATVAKFHQLYRTSDKNGIYQSVTGLVRLCQTALMLFDQLETDYSDGLLCDVTERAISDWWLNIGSERYQLEPHDGILGPTTVASLLGLLMGARNRLHEVGAPVTKDAFCVETMKRGISHFQKQQRLERTGRLDRLTLSRLHKVTQKTDHGHFTLPKVIKHTAAELSGKGGNIVMEAVGRGRDRVEIADIETTDMETFVQFLYGEQPKWLWMGKPIKIKSKAEPSQTMVFDTDDKGGFLWTKKSIADMQRESFDMPTPARETFDSDPVKQNRSTGLGKLKGWRGHERAKFSVDEKKPVKKPQSPVVEERGVVDEVSVEETRSEQASVHEPVSPIGSFYHDVDLDEVLPSGEETETNVPLPLRRTLSSSHSVKKPSVDAYPRHLSFSLAEESVLRWEQIADSQDQVVAQRTYSALCHLISTTEPWASCQLAELGTLLEEMSCTVTEVEELRAPRAEEVHEWHTRARDVVASERENAENLFREMESLKARLEYGVESLRGRVEDVEDGVEQYKVGVARVEQMVEELTKERDGWCVAM
ncbi:hypothetical protein K470DRAFT_219309 [Piedraia hortae CBS 480.64]|uniref:STB6-like N-terminal domain-containing protein n=1 Tax=Piedraia hortae CBS 480.64 TaxID=1314780 RepID=A0A6A7BX73_9PEZI|nr:hypothetical protein K470DRAFT_219309 [Piedraia hortae CBS 480.64]